MMMDIRSSLRCFTVCLTLLMNACGGGSGSASAPVPPEQAAKVYALMDVGDSTSVLDSFAVRETVDGLAFRTSWNVLEPQEGVFDWTTLDAAFDTVRARGKQLTLHVGVSSLGTPRWLAALGVDLYTYQSNTGEVVTAPLPWDAIFLTNYTQFLSELASHVQARGDTSLLYAVSDGAPVGEMSIEGCLDGTLGGSISYSRTDYMNAWETTIDAHAAGFPATRLFISAPFISICKPDSDGKAFYTELMNNALSKSINATVFAADLNAAGSARMMQVDASVSALAAIGFQTIWSSTNDTQNRMQGTLKDAVCHGIDNGARYFEIYKADISSLNVGIRDAIQRARAGQAC